MSGTRAVAGVDVGGTFTDVVVAGDGPPRLVKVPTTPDDQSRGVGAGIAAAAVEARAVAHGTTTATNALLERDVARTVLVTTAGFADLLVIARQDRPSLYDLTVERPAPVVHREDVVTVAERVAADGAAVIELTDAEVDRVVGAVAARSPGAIAVCLLFGYVDGRHERRLGAALQHLGVPVTLSCELLPEHREYERASTVSVNAAITPVMRRYLDRLESRVEPAHVTVMTSAGGTATAAAVADAPVATLLSGPAAGVVAAGAVARRAGHRDAVAFDMGGTSSDVCLVLDGRAPTSTTTAVGGLPVAIPTVAVHTVGAGGGSIAWLDAGGALRVGPRSAGARPGPACYGLGGTQPTVTDAHCALGHLPAGRRLGAGEEGPRLDRDAALRALDGLPPTAGGAGGVLAVVRAGMVRALRAVTTERGVDPSDLALVAYGGAGPLHAAALARELGCAAVVVPPVPGVLSALGLLLAPPRSDVTHGLLREVDHDDVSAAWADLSSRAHTSLVDQGVDAGQVEVTLAADVRAARQSHELRVELGKAGTPPDAETIAEAFHDAHERAYGYALRDEPVVVVAARATATGPPVLAELPERWDLGPAVERSTRTIGVVGSEGQVDEVEATVVARSGLAAGDVVCGPAIVEQSDTTTLVPSHATAEVHDSGSLVIRISAPDGGSARG